MAVTRLKRKGKRNKIRSKVRQTDIQRLNAKPVIKGVDIEKIKEEFAENLKKAPVKKEAPKVEATTTEVEKKPAAKKAAAKKEDAPKAEKKKAAPK
jgi:hypothetical protein